MNLIDKIDAFLLKEYNKPRESHYPSDIAACSRQLFYKWKNTPKSNPITAGAVWKMKMGIAIHKMINEFLEKTGFEIIDEIEFKHKHPELTYKISGRIDNMFVEPDKTLSTIEIKSTFGRGVKAIQLEGPPKKDLYQIFPYLLYTEIKRLYLVYIGRDNAYRTQFIITLGDNKKMLCNENELDITEDEIIKKLARLEIFLEDNEIPPKEYLAAIKEGEIIEKFSANKKEYKSDWQCRYCQWGNLCWDITIHKSRIEGKFFDGIRKDIKGNC